MHFSKHRSPKATAQTSTAEIVAPKKRDAITEALPTRAHYKLDDLLAEITDENLHGEIAWGAPVGKEYW